MREETKYKLKIGFGTIIKNDACIESAKHIKGFVPIIIGLVAAFLPVIPLMVTTAKTYGSQFLKSSTYNLDRYNTSVMMNVKEEGYDFKLVGGQLLRYKDDQVENMSFDDDASPIGEYISKSDSGNPIKYQLFYSERINTGAKEEKIKTLVSDITSTTYLEGTIFVKGSGDAEAYIKAKQDALGEGETYTPTYYRPSFTVIYKLGLYTYVNNETTGKQAATYGGDWKHSQIVEGLLATILKSEIETDIYEKDANGDYKVLRNSEFTAEIQKNMNKVYDLAYLTTKQNSFLLYTFVFYGVYVVLIAFMGLMIFLLTRGKKNPMNYMSFWLSTKIAAWATISPAVLALILGFLLTNFATMFFIILFGVRIMWLSMRQLRPAY